MEPLGTWARWPGLTLDSGPATCDSKCGPWTCGISTSGELVARAEARAPPATTTQPVHFLHSRNFFLISFTEL